MLLQKNKAIPYSFLLFLVITIRIITCTCLNEDNADARSNPDISNAIIDINGSPIPLNADVRATAVIRYLAISNSQSPSFSFSLSVMLQIYNLILNTANGLLYFFYCQRLVTVIYDRRTMGDEDHRPVVPGEYVLQELAFCLRIKGRCSLVKDHDTAVT